jgi:hypothetical protein
MNMARRVIWAAGINDDRRIARHVSKRFLPMERDAIRSVGGKDKGGVNTDVRLRVTEQIAQEGHVGCGRGSFGPGGGKGGMPGLGIWSRFALISQVFTLVFLQGFSPLSASHFT